MVNERHLPGIASARVPTDRLTQHVLFSGPEDGIPVLFVHGNASSATFWEETMLALPDGYRGVAPDLRGFGDTDDEPIDATRGTGDWVDDLLALKRALGLDRYHVAGHSLGGAVLWNLTAHDGPSLRSVTLVAPGSPFGFGGTRDVEGTPTYADFAGSGGGTVNADMVRMMAEGYRGTEGTAAPRNVMNALYWKPPFRPEREEELLSSMLSEKIGDDRYPGDATSSEHWPGVAPGRWGPINAISPKYVGDSVERFVAVRPKPPILWVWGADDRIVSDTSTSEPGYLGKIGAVPGWPGEEVYPPQPMVSQTRAVLDRYRGAGGSYREVRLADSGHTPYLDQAEAFQAAFVPHLRAADGR